MSDFLTLCQEMRSDAGISGTGPTTVIGQTGILGRIVYSIRDAWIKIQSDPKDWKWMWRDDQGAVQTIINTTDYVLTGVQKVHRDTVTIYKNSIGTSDISTMKYLDWATFKAKFGALQSSDADRPAFITELPSGNIRVHPKPDAAYTIDFESQKTPQILAANVDVPEMPERFHQLIKYEALIRFGGLEDAPEVVETAKTEAAKLRRELEWDQELIRNDENLVVIPE